MRLEAVVDFRPKIEAIELMRLPSLSPKRLESSLLPIDRRLLVLPPPSR